MRPSVAHGTACIYQLSMSDTLEPSHPPQPIYAATHFSFYVGLIAVVLHILLFLYRFHIYMYFAVVFTARYYAERGIVTGSPSICDVEVL